MTDDSNQIAQLWAAIEGIKNNPPLLDHRHNGFDVSPVRYADLTEKPAAAVTVPPSVITGSRDCSVASGAVNYAHGMSTTPKWVQIHASWGYTIGSNTFSPTYQSIGMFVNGGSQKCIYTGETGGLNSHSIVHGAQASAAVYIYDLAIGSGGTQSGVMSINSTNIVITWTKASTPTVVADLIFFFGV